MAGRKSPKPLRDSPVPVRYRSAERRYLEAAWRMEVQDVRSPETKRRGLSEFIRVAALNRAERVLGMSLAEFELKEKRE